MFLLQYSLEVKIDEKLRLEKTLKVGSGVLILNLI